MNRIKWIGLLLVWTALLCGGNSKLRSQDAKEQATKELTTASLNDVKWIAGHWQGSAMGGAFEETWNPPFAGTMVGMFKFAKEDKVQFYELLTIVEKDKSLLLRLKHFDRNLVGWEEKDKSVEFPLRELTANRAAFEGLVFSKVDANHMDIEVTVSKKDSQPQTIRFSCQRVRASESVK